MGRKGILPTILINLLSARKVAKKAMQEAKDPMTKTILNGKQLALKISCSACSIFFGCCWSRACHPLAQVSASVLPSNGM